MTDSSNLTTDQLARIKALVDAIASHRANKNFIVWILMIRDRDKIRHLWQRAAGRVVADINLGSVCCLPTMHFSITRVLCCIALLDDAPKFGLTCRSMFDQLSGAACDAAILLPFALNAVPAEERAAAHKHGLTRAK
jgi:hypothetical protein